MYTVDYFIKKFEAIPEKLWCIRDLYAADNRRCAMGHCGVNRESFVGAAQSGVFKSSEESMALISLFGILALTINNHQTANDSGWKDYSFNVSYVNDGDSDQYKQPTPKARILAALHDIKAMQEPEPKPERVKTVYVSVPETIKEQTGELILS